MIASLICCNMFSGVDCRLIVVGCCLLVVGSWRGIVAVLALVAVAFVDD